MQKKNQQGSVLMLLVPIVAVLLVAAIGGVWWAMSHKKVVPKAAVSSVSADEPLTNGNANADLSQDVRILNAGVDRDGSYVSSANKALNDQAQPVLDN